jgi:hypothetical protein
LKVTFLFAAALLLRSATLGGAQEPEANPNFDFSGMERFWDVVSVLEADRDPTTDQWSALFETPGYRALTASEFDRSFLQDAFTLAFRPPRDARLSGELVEQTVRRYVEHYRQVGERRTELEEQQRLLRTEPISTAAREAAFRYLPEIPISEDPPVAFVIFANDGRGYSPIVIDLLASMLQDLNPFMAHEFHHWFRNRILEFDRDSVDPEDASLMWVLDQIQAEGIADLIDKRRWFEREGEARGPGDPGYVVRFRENVRQAPEFLRSLDRRLIAIAEDPSGRQAIGEEIRELLPQSGHPVGYYMASRILEELGLAPLVERVGSPFHFFRLFNEATEEAGGDPILSTGAIHWIDSLEERYATKWR